MYCNKCGAELKKGDSFCGYCGNKIGDTIENEPKVDNNVAEESKVNNTFEDEELINAFMGPKADKFKGNDFSFLTLFFRGLYLLYRKMYLYGLLWIFALPIVAAIIPIIGGILPLAAAIVMGIYFNKIYLDFVKKKVAEIKNIYKGKTREELIEICKTKGGTTWVPVIIYIVITVVISVAIIAFFIYLIRSGEFDDIIDSDFDIDNIVEETKENTVYEKDTELEKESLLYLVPKGFEETYSSQYTTSYNYSSSDYSDYCYFSIEVTNNYGDKNIQDIMEDEVYIEANDEISKSFTTVNGQEWYSINLDRSLGRHYYNYGIVRNGKKYIYEFSAVKSGDVCGPAKDKILNSLKFGDNNV